MITVDSAYTAANAARSKTPVHLVKISAYPSNLVGAWTLSETSGNRVDYTGRNYFAPGNAPGTSAGKTGATALQLNAASSQYLATTVYDASNLIMNDESFMLTCWVYLDSKGADRTIVSQWRSDAGNQGWFLWFNNSGDRFAFNVIDITPTQYTATANAFGSPSTGTWYFIVAWFDRTLNTVNIRVNNGTTNSAATGTVQMQATLTDVRVGAIDATPDGVPDTFWNGRIEQLTWWRRILTNAEQSALYNGGSGADFSVVTDPSPVIFSTSRNLSRENLGTQVLEPQELIFETLMRKSEAPLTTLTFQLRDKDGAISALVATGLLGYKVRFYSGYYGLTLSQFTQVFGGRITEIEAVESAFQFTCRSYLMYAQSKLILGNSQTVLRTAVNSTDTTFVVADASAFPQAQSTPQSFRKLILTDSELCDYRGRIQNADGTWNLTSVVRSAAGGFPFPPSFGAPNSHSANAIVRYLPKLGSLVPENNQAANNWLHPIRQMQDLLNKVGNEGLGEFLIPLFLGGFLNTETLLGPSVQTRYVFSDAINGKSQLEAMCRDIGGFLVEKSDGSLYPKIYPLATSLHAAWKLEESTGNRFDVMHVNRNRNYDLMPSGTPTSTTGKIGSAVQLVAASSQYLWRSYGGLQPASCDFSVAVWAYLDSKGAFRTVCGQYNEGDVVDEAWRIAYNNASDRFIFTVGNGTSLVTLTANTFGSPSTTTWYLIIATFNRSTFEMSLSINNGTADTATGVRPVPTDEEFRVGASGSGGGTASYWDGRLDELGLWYDHILTASEKTWLYNSGTGRAIEDFSAAFPTFTPVGATTVTDSNVTDRPVWIRNGEIAYNHVIYHYDFIPPTNQYASTFDYKDNALIASTGKDIPLEIFSNGLRSRFYLNAGGGSIFCWFDSTERFLMSRAEAIIQRFGREAPTITATSMYSKHIVESADDVTLTFDQIVDLTSGIRSLSGALGEVGVVRRRYREHLIDFEFVKYA